MEKEEKEKEEQKESIVNMAKGDDRPASVNKMLKRPYKQKEKENEKKKKMRKGGEKSRGDDR